jgi:hypothetical protein
VWRGVELWGWCREARTNKPENATQIVIPEIFSFYISKEMSFLYFELDVCFLMVRARKFYGVYISTPYRSITHIYNRGLLCFLYQPSMLWHPSWIGRVCPELMARSRIRTWSAGLQSDIYHSFSHLVSNVSGERLLLQVRL